jgi:ABC-type multidrug transport system fused ATPase/permease subunit
MFAGGTIPWQLREFHRLVSVRDMLSSRVVGLAYEPSWLGNQLVILYLPLWAASVIRRTSSISRAPERILPELILLVWGLAILVLSKSRISLLSLLAVTFVVALVWLWRRAERALQRARPWIRHALGPALVVGLVVLSVGVVFTLGRFDTRLSRLFTLNLAALRDSSTPFYHLANELAYAERVMYWESGIGVFSRYPVFGVGLGNTGLLFPQTVPSFGFALPEIIRILEGAPQFPNPKSLWIRLLAETGLVGFLFFVTWLALTAEAARRVVRHSTSAAGVIGLAALFALGAQIVEGFSLDTFALPQLWLILGMATAASFRLDRYESGAPGGSDRHEPAAVSIGSNEIDKPDDQAAHQAPLPDDVGIRRSMRGSERASWNR